MKKAKQILSVLMSLIMILSIIPMTSLTAFAEDASTSGMCGDNVTWFFDESTGTLTIGGAGKMYNYHEGNTPYDCYYDRIETVIIGDDVTAIGEYAFYNFYLISNITIGNSVTDIGDAALRACSSLTNINVDLDNKTYSSEDGVLFNKDKTILVQYPIGNAKTTYSIPDTITQINNYAFSYSRYLVDVIIPDSVTTIGNSAFYFCTALTSIKIPNNVKEIADNVFGECNSLTNVEIPNNVTKIGNYSFYFCRSLTNITIPEGVTVIGGCSFYACESLTSIEIPNSVVLIGGCAFYGCNLVDITIGYGLTQIEDEAFYYCEKLTNVYYAGSENKWHSISIGSHNEPLLNSTIHFNCCNHNYEMIITPPTCTTTGYTTYTCDCGERYIADYVNAKGHTYSSEVTKEATHLETGVITYTCACGASYTEEIAKTTEHTYTAVTTAPTCTEQGYTTYTCACGNSYVDNYTDATGHADNDEDGYCDVCNEFLYSTEDCDCNCHKSGISKFFFDFILFFQRLFGSNKTCACGVEHY